MMTMDNIQKIDMKVIPRVETGPMEFAQDWPGVFIRGDNAMAYALYLDTILEYIEVDDFEDYIAVANVKALSDLLKSCNINKE